MRAVFLVLVLANLAFFAWANFFSEGDTQSDPRPSARQIAPDKLRVLPPVPPARQAPAGALKPVADVTAQALPAKACLEVGAFSITDAPRAAETLAALSLGARLSQRRADESATWWVFIPPRATRQDAQKKAAELKALGIEDYFVVQDEGPVRNAVSLGIFKTEAAANARLEALRAKGVKTAQAGARETPARKIYFQVKTPDAALTGKLRELAQPFPGTEVRDCATGPVNGGAAYLPMPRIASTTMRVPVASSRMLSSTRT